MKRLLPGVLVLLAFGMTLVWGSREAGFKTSFPSESRNPVTHLRWNDDPREFQFAIVSDRTGGHRADVFAQACEKLNLLQPAFVLSVGDLIEGAKTDETLARQWKEFDSYVGRLSMPFFYVAGNHDVASVESDRFWKEKLGRRYYHFIYRNVLFLILNTDDPPEGKGSIGKEQIAYAQKVLAENPDVHWTVVALHRPLWASPGANGWLDVEKALAGRRYTVFAGHVHRYQKFVRNGMNYYQLATTGGSSMMRGVDQTEFDHIVWVTMKKDGPLFANLLLDAIQTEDLQRPKTNEPGTKTAGRKPTFPVQGKVYFNGTPIPGAQVTVHVMEGLKARGSRAVGTTGPDGSFQLSTYQGFDGAPAGEYKLTVVWRDLAKDGLSRTGPNQLPAKYALPSTSPLRATIQAGKNEVVLELVK